MDKELGYCFPTEIIAPALELVNLYDSIDDSKWSVKKTKPFMRLNSKFNSKDPTNPFIKLADTMAPHAAKYLGSNKVEFYWAGVSRTHYTGKQWKASQLYHRDWEDDRAVKIFVLLRDVEQKHGPLTFIDAVGSQVVTNKLGYINDRSHRKSDEEIYNAYKGEPLVLVGKAGTMAMVDTCRCFHYGGRTLEGARLMACIQFLKPGHRGTFSTIKTYNMENI